MENDITANPDYQLIMSFLKSIRPGDMSDEAATQLKMIGERIQSGGSLSDQEREMFQSVMGAMPQMPMDQGPMAGSAMTGLRCGWHGCQWTLDQRLANLNCQALMELSGKGFR
jgi:hypothetical protein